jgi:hypothetical protein
MPRFIPNGPVVPDNLVQDLEDDRVVLFCGAGISMAAGLPSYGELVEHCYRELGHPVPNKTHTDWLWPDRMLGALEAKTSPRNVRRVAVERLSRDPTTLDVHRALLRLARLRNHDGFRLVTTNFDLLFERARTDLLLGHDYHSGPILPIPRNDRIGTWRSMVYLHGRLNKPDGENSHLVLTSADFGRAYLTDAWAARFVARLFADFTVLFVGYSLNDPVLRYMTDAFAAEDAETRGGPSRGPAYIFVPHRKAPPDPQPYHDRRLVPIFYNQTHRHARLKNTLLKWAKARDDYFARVLMMVSGIAPNPPATLDPSATSDLLWAVLGRPGDNGYGANVFADLIPAPSLEWLAAFERREAELRRDHDAAVKAAQMAERNPPPEPPLHVGQLFPLIGSNDSHRLTPIGQALIRWLLRHLRSLALVEWTLGKISEGRRPHALLRYQIRQHLVAPDEPLPRGFELFWRIVSSEGGWALRPGRGRAPSGLSDSLPTARDEAWVRQELSGALRPCLVLERSIHRRLRAAIDPESGIEVPGHTLAEIANAEVALADEEHLHQFIELIDRTETPDAFWAEQLHLLTAHLRQVLELFAVADEADRDRDPSVFHRPSIEPHAQNRHHERWTILFDLIWRGWTHVDRTNPDESRRQISAWRRIPFLAFRRLVLACVRHSPHVPTTEKLEALLDG